MTCKYCNGKTVETIVIKGIKHYLCGQCEKLNDPTNTKFKFVGGLINHSKKNNTCIVAYPFETDKTWFLVRFEDETIEGCSIDDLILSSEQDL